MRVVLQRAARASVSVDGETIASIGPGLLMLVGVSEGDNAGEAARIAGKCAEMRIFSDDEGRFNLSLLDTGGEALVVSQFTLLADVRRGRRPSFDGAARPKIAEPIVEAFVAELRRLGVGTQTGRFGAKMAVELVNEGPVTIVVDSAELDRPRRA
ncbi:MAG TPA: D-aminoacyl-tRNA deacylase [Dehalococcoidia bacterium]|nr:D-aminoacyl-tRNA deacylase [Dehalococcoidia bacterium]